MNPIGTPFTNSPAPTARVLLRRLPPNTTTDSVRTMFLYTGDVTAINLVPAETPEDEGFCSAMVKFKTMAAAFDAREKLDGRPNIANTAEMIVEILPTSPIGTNNHAIDRSPPDSSAAISPTAVAPASSGVSNPAVSSLPLGNGSFHTRINGSPNDAFGHVSSDFYPGIGAPGHSRELFSPTSPVANHFQDRTRVSGKSLIENNLTDDDDTSALLRNPLAYAENGSASGSTTSGRRATAPSIPIAQLSRLRLNTNMAPASAPMPSQYGQPMSAYPSSAAPPYQGLGQGFPGSHRHYRSQPPPINPADQNPPCNTLYVGNLPSNTSEEELKQLFTKQRGYKRMCFRTKHNGPMCFVEFEDVTHATKTLNELYGHILPSSQKGGIRLSFSKNPLGVRSTPNTGPNNHGAVGNMNGSINGSAGGFNTAIGPPPGIPAPPGIPPQGYNSLNGTAPSGNRYPQNGFTGAHNYPWNGPPQQGNYGPPGGLNGSHTPNGMNGVHTPNGLYGTSVMNGINGAINGGPNGGPNGGLNDAPYAALNGGPNGAAHDSLYSALNDTPSGNGSHDSAQGSFPSNGNGRPDPRMRRP